MDWEFATGMHFNETNKYHNLFKMPLGGPRSGLNSKKVGSNLKIIWEVK
jgi:hypothetical protein